MVFCSRLLCMAWPSLKHKLVFPSIEIHSTVFCTCIWIRYIQIPKVEFWPLCFIQNWMLLCVGLKIIQSWMIYGGCSLYRNSVNLMVSWKRLICYRKVSSDSCPCSQMTNMSSMYRHQTFGLVLVEAISFSSRFCNEQVCVWWCHQIYCGDLHGMSHFPGHHSHLGGWHTAHGPVHQTDWQASVPDPKQLSYQTLHHYNPLQPGPQAQKYLLKVGGLWEKIKRAEGPPSGPWLWGKLHWPSDSESTPDTPYAGPTASPTTTTTTSRTPGGHIPSQNHHPDKNSQTTPPHTTCLQEPKTSHPQPTL